MKIINKALYKLSLAVLFVCSIPSLIFFKKEKGLYILLQQGKALKDFFQQ